MQNVASQKSYWDRVADKKRFSHPLRLDSLGRYSENPGARVLDYGCGYGRTLAELAAAGYERIFGADFSAAMLARAREEVPRARLVRNDGQTFPFQADSFDLVLLFAVLTCIPDSIEQRTLLSEVERVLRPGGVVYLSDVLVNDDERNRERYQQYAAAYGCYGVFELPEGVVVRHHRREWIEEITAAFRQLEYVPFEVTTMNGNAAAAFQYLGRKPGRNDSL